MTAEATAEDLLRTLAPQVLGALVRRHGRFDACEDAVQEALRAAATQWPDDGIPDNPRGWLAAVARRRLVDEVRRETARRRREDTALAMTEPQVDNEPVSGTDDGLTLLFLCCHPSVTPASQVALTLRAVGGLTTAQIAAAFLVPEATMGPRISRAKQQIRQAGARFELPSPSERPGRLAVVEHVLYLMFNEGYTSTSGRELHRPDLAAEAIRLARLLHATFPEDGEVTGLLALMLLTDARRLARTDERGDLVPLAEQDRTRWDHRAIAEGTALATAALGGSPVGPYGLQAAIAAVHDEAMDPSATDWPQILGLYAVLARIAPNPVVTLNRAVAVAMVQGPAAGLELLATLDGTPLAAQHRLPAVRAHLLELAGDVNGAAHQYRLAARRTASLAEQRYLERRSRALRGRIGED